MDNKKSTKELYKDTFQMIRPSDHSVTQMLYRTEENKMRTKRLMPRRRVLVLTTICCMLFASACFAASMIVNYEGHAPSTPQCTNYDDLSSITNDLGYEATIPESFSNGYAFENATLGTEEGKDADGNTVSSGKFIDVVYSSPNTGDVNLDVNPIVAANDSSIYNKTRDVNGVTVGGGTFIMKFVPPDYEKTEEDIALESEGNFQISYGSDSIEEHSYVSASIEKDGIQYTLLADGDNQPSLDALMDMAAEMLE